MLVLVSCFSHRICGVCPAKVDKMAWLKNRWWTKITVHGGTLLKSVCPVWFLGKATYFESVFFHNEMFCATNVKLVLGFHQTSFENRFQDIFLWIDKYPHFDKFGSVDIITPCFCVFSSSCSHVHVWCVMQVIWQSRLDFLQDFVSKSKGYQQFDILGILRLFSGLPDSTPSGHYNLQGHVNPL